LGFLLVIQHGGFLGFLGFWVFAFDPRTMGFWVLGGFGFLLKSQHGGFVGFGGFAFV